MIEQAVYSVRGARRLRAIVGRCEFGTPPAEFLNHFGDAATEMFRAPFPQTAQTLREFALGFGPIDVPDTRQNFLSQLACATGGDLDHRVQVAQYQCDLREEQAPSFAGRRPTIATNRAWAIVGEDCFGFRSELAIAGLQTFSIVLLINGDAQKATAAGRGRDRNFLTINPADLFINDQIARHSSLGFDRRADQVGAPEREPSSIPEHLVAPKDVGQSRKWHIPLAQIECLLDLISPGHTVGQNKRGPDGEDSTVLLEPDAPQGELELLRLVLVVKVVASSNRLGEQFWMGCDLPVEKFPKLAMVFDAFGVLFFTLERETDIFSTSLQDKNDAGLWS
jgi:hypothetical protein